MQAMDSINKNNNKSFPFLALPAELREKIYHHVLARQRILISYNQTLPSKENQETKKPIPKGLVAISETPSLDNGRRRKGTTFELPTPYASPTTPTLLLTSRQISLEASYILYTRTAFDFTTLPSIRPLLELIGSRNRSFLSRIRISSWNRLGFKSALSAIRELCPGVRGVEIGVWKFDTYAGQWEGFLREVVDGLGREMLWKVRFFVAGGEVWERRGICVLGSRQVEGRGVRDWESFANGTEMAREEDVSPSCGADLNSCGCCCETAVLPHHEKEAGCSMCIG